MLVSRISLSLLLSLLCLLGQAQNQSQSTKELLDYWKSDKSFKHLMSFTFTQETIRFKDSLAPDTSTWYEAIQFPNNFRIDFAYKSKNSNLYRNDSIYVLRKGKLVHQGVQIQDFMLMSGGFYYHNTKSCLTKLREIGIDTDLFHKTVYNGRDVFVIGTQKGDLGRAQIWLDVERRSVLRQFLKGKDGSLTEVRFSGFREIDGHWIESWLEFYRDGKLIQTERYYDIQVHPKLNPEIFSPSRFSNSYWY